jgi:Fe-S cluster assembly ATPase SufC
MTPALLTRKSGGPELALKLEESGYDWLEEENAQKAEV